MGELSRPSYPLGDEVPKQAEPSRAEEMREQLARAAKENAAEADELERRASDRRAVERACHRALEALDEDRPEPSYG